LRKEWLSGVRKVVNAPPGAHVAILTDQAKAAAGGDAVAIRVVDDADAPAYRRVDFDTTHPYRQRELLDLLNRRLRAETRVTGYDIQCVRKQHGVDGNDDFFHMPRYGGSPQYSDAFVDWLVANNADDPDFFSKARNAKATRE
jgi:hypothetical protein